MKPSPERIKNILSKNSSLQKFSRNECKGMENTTGNCYAISAVQFLSFLFYDLDDADKIMEEFCIRSGDENGANLYEIYSLFFNFSEKLNDHFDKNIIDIYITDDRTVSLLKEDGYLVSRANFDEYCVILFSFYHITFDDLIDISSICPQYTSQAFYLLVNYNHIVCIRKCGEDYFLFDNDDVIKLNYIPFDFMSDPNVLLEFNKTYKRVICIAVLLTEDF